MNDGKTAELLDILKSINSYEALENHLDTNLSNITTYSFNEYFNYMCENNDLKKSLILNNSGLSKSYFYQVLDGSKNPSRDTIIKLSISAGFTLEETERSLLLGKALKLYAKDLRDSIIIFCINKGFNLINTNIFLDSKNLLPL